MVQGKRVYGLDILRAIAILTVLIGHSGAMLPDFIDNVIQRYDLDGVSIFFVLSGFLIGQILLKIVNQSHFTIQKLWGFWLRRWFRTLPAYYATILLLLIFYYFSGNFPSSQAIFGAITFSQSLFKHVATLYREGWSLSVEEWFYLLIPLALFTSHRLLKLKWRILFPFLILTIIFGTAVLRIYQSRRIDFNNLMIWDTYIRSATVMRMDSIMFGVLGHIYIFTIQRFGKTK